MASPRDFVELLVVFGELGVRYLVVGGYAVGFHGVPRFTKDLDLLIAADGPNVQRCAEALQRFGAPGEVVAAMRGSTQDDVVWLGKPPLRIDILQTIPGVEFESAWTNRVEFQWLGVTATVIGATELVASKLAAGRPQDRLDAKALARLLRR